MSDGDRIARARMRSQGLWGPGMPSPADVVARLTAVQAQEHLYARWSVAQRVAGGADAGAVDLAFDGGQILRTHVLRPTWHYVARQDLRWLMALSGARVVARGARRHQELGLDAPTLALATDVIASAVAEGPLTRRQLAAVLERHHLPADGPRLSVILMHAELRAVICSGPMNENQHTYASFDQRVPQDGARDEEEALGELARRYFEARGPATLRDFVWWSGLSTADARRGLDIARAGLSSTQTGEHVYWFVDREERQPALRADLVQCYDEIIISYGPTRAVLRTSGVDFAVPRSIAGFRHVILLDGRLLGHWRLGKDGLVETRIERHIDKSELVALNDAVDRFGAFSAGRSPSP